MSESCISDSNDYDCSMKKYSLTLFGLLFSLISLAQNDSSTSKNDDEILKLVDESAVFPGGITKFFEFIESELEYPELAFNNEIEGRVFVQFIIEKDGSLSNMKIAKGIGAGCDEEVIRILSKSPNWTPAKDQGEVVRQLMIQNIYFNLKKEKEKRKLGN